MSPTSARPLLPQERAAWVRPLREVFGDATERWLGPRLVRGIGCVPALRRVAFVSSRLPRLLDPAGTWLNALRSAISFLNTQHNLLMAATGTTTARFVERCAELHHFHLLRLEVNDGSQPPGELEASNTCELSPMLDPDYVLPDRLQKVPARDRALVGLADVVFVLRLRRGGNVHALLQERLAHGPGCPAAVIVATAGELVPPRLQKELRDRGAQPADFEPPVQLAKPEVAERAGILASALVPLQDVADLPLLGHCTRSNPGPWPGQSDDEYLDNLILGRPEADHSSLAALRRILQLRRLTASSSTIRGGYRVVSLTAAPLRDLAHKRVFRRHRARWDFEPYGIAILRDWLVARGARPVCYGDESVWQRLTEPERPFFQLIRPHAATSIDWSAEQEWRHAGDLDLADLPANAGVVFVPTEREARLIAAHSFWPVTVIREVRQL